MFKKNLRVMRLGRSNLVMTVPAIWRDRNNIHPGDSLQVLISENELIIRPLKERSESGGELVARRPPDRDPRPSSPKEGGVQ